MRLNRGQLIVMPVETSTNRRDALEKARAVTLTTIAVAQCVNAIGVHWFDSWNLLPLALLPRVGASLAPKGGKGSLLWVRALAAQGPTAAQESPLLCLGPKVSRRSSYRNWNRPPWNGASTKRWRIYMPSPNTCLEPTRRFAGETHSALMECNLSGFRRTIAVYSAHGLRCD